MAETFRLRIYRKLPRFLVLSAGKLHKSEKWVPLATSLIFVGKKDIGKKKVLLFHLICKKSTSKVFFCWSISNCLPQNKWFFFNFLHGRHQQRKPKTSIRKRCILAIMEAAVLYYMGFGWFLKIASVCYWNINSFVIWCNLKRCLVMPCL